MDALAALDHASLEYDDFAKDFYEEAPEVFAMDDKEVSRVMTFQGQFKWGPQKCLDGLDDREAS